MNKTEKELRVLWLKWEKTCHPDDSIPFNEFVDEYKHSNKDLK